MMPLSKIIVFAFLFLLPAVQLIRDWKFHDKRTRLYRRITYAVVTAYIVLLIPSVFILYSDVRQAAQTREDTQASQNELIRRANEEADAQGKLRDKSDQIAALYQRIAQAQTELAQSQRGLRINAEEQANQQRQLRNKSDEIAALNKLLAAKSDQIADLNREIAANVTGGDSYCYFDVRQSPLAAKALPDTVELMLIRVGKYPVYDVAFTINDAEILKKQILSEPRRLLHMTFEDIVASMSPLTQKTVGNIGAQQTGPYIGQRYVFEVQPVQLNLAGADHRQYMIHITARNGYVNQSLSFLRVNGEWKKASRVIFNDNKVQDSADYDFPEATPRGGIK